MSSDAHAAIVAANQRFMESFAGQDAAGIAALYTQDGQLLPGNSDFVTGPAGIEKFWRGAMGMGIKTVRLESLELEVHGDAAVEVGKYTLGAEGGQTVDHGKYLVVWKHDGGHWRLHRDIWNSSMPAG